MEYKKSSKCQVVRSMDYDHNEIKLFKKLNSPKKIQDFLNSVPVNFEKKGETCMSPRFVIKNNKAHCMEGAMLAAAILEFHGHKPLLLDLRSIKPEDDDHVVALYKQFGCWAAISKTNHAVLRYREPIYKTIRELALSYFHEYFLDSGVKTLREYSAPFNLAYFDNASEPTQKKRGWTDWRTAEGNLFEIPQALDEANHFFLLGRNQITNLRKADKIEIKAGKLVEFKK